MPSIHVIYASTSGHTEYVAGILAETLKQAGAEVELQRAERVTGEDLLRGDVLVLMSSTWNTGNVEGQLNPHMWTLLLDRAKDIALGGKKTACVALGDERYHFRANAAVHLEQFATTHGGTLVTETLKMLNEPYGQEEKVKTWAKTLLSSLA